MPAPRPDSVVANVNSVSRIAAGTVIKGEITSKTDLRLDGYFEGRIFSQGKVVIGETAEVKGDVMGNSVDMMGKITGNIFVKDTLSLKNGTVITGNVTTRRLVVELGSVFNGNCKMGGQDAPSAEETPAQDAPEEE